MLKFVAIVSFVLFSTVVTAADEKAGKKEAAQRAAQLKEYNTAYSEIKISSSDAEKTILAKGPKRGLHSLAIRVEGDTWSLRSSVVNQGNVTHRLHFAQQYHDDWRFYGQASFDGGEAASFTKVNHRTVDCQFSQTPNVTDHIECFREEEFTINIPTAKLVAAYQLGSELHIEIIARDGRIYPFTLPAYYIQAYVSRLNNEGIIKVSNIKPVQGLSVIENRT